jgi:hypothetical protein
MDTAALTIALAKLQKDAGTFVKAYFKATPDPWQAEVLDMISTGERQISIRSGHGVGKTTLLAWTAIWFLMTRLGSKIVVTAPTSSQLMDALLPEMKSWIGQMPHDMRQLLTVKQDRIELAPAPERNFISARTSRAEQPDALQGVHAKNVLLVCDEASGIPDQVFDASGGSMSSDNAQMILAGNPVRSQGLFWKTHTLLGDRWKTFHVSCLDSPRVTRDFIEEKSAEYGEDSNAYRVRVLGEFPQADDDTCIPVELIDTAVGRDIELDPLAEVIWGLDVARFGSDRSALCKRAGRVVTEPVQLFSGSHDLMAITGFVKAAYDAAPPDRKPAEIMVDAIGVGGGVCDRLMELGLPARSIMVSEVASLGGNYHRLRDELWFKAKEYLAGRDVRLPTDPVLTHELAIPRFGYTSAGKLKVESKQEMRRRGNRSPDAADAFVLTFASEGATARHGYRSSWNKSVKRELKWIN